MIATLHPCDKGVILSAPATAPCSPGAAPWILAATILGSSLAFIDGSVVNLALPSLQANFNATVVDVQWVIEAYALFLAALLLVGGSLGDIYGRKRIYVAGIVLFSAASIWCGLASTVGQLIFGRAIQGIGAAAINVEPGIRREIESQREKLAAIDIPQELDAVERRKIQQSIDESFIYGFRFVVLVASGLALLSSATAWLMIDFTKHSYRVAPTSLQDVEKDGIIRPEM